MLQNAARSMYRSDPWQPFPRFNFSDSNGSDSDDSDGGDGGDVSDGGDGGDGGIGGDDCDGDGGDGGGVNWNNCIAIASSPRETAALFKGLLTAIPNSYPPIYMFDHPPHPTSAVRSLSTAGKDIACQHQLRGSLW